MIGLKHKATQLCDHQAEWESEAKRTISQLKRILGSAAKDIQHVGSTSIASIKAKPVIDIAIAVDDFESVLACEKELKQNGFFYCANSSLQNQLLFACGSYYDGTGDMQTHLIHVVLADSMDWKNYIIFRDYLNKTPELAKAYEDLKVSLAEKQSVDSLSKEYMNGKHDFVVYTLRKALVDSYLGKTVNIEIDRPIGYIHDKGKYSLDYPINYGYIPGVIGGDGEELDVYLLGVDVPVEKYTCRIIGIIHREDDVEDKLVGAPVGKKFYQSDIYEAVKFQEQYYKTTVESVYEKSCGAIVYRKTGENTEYLCLHQRRSNTYSVPKGHALPFETEEQTAQREIMEEIGVTAKFVPGFKEEIEYPLAGGKSKTVTLFLLRWDDDIKVNIDEISDYSWEGIDEAKKLLRKPYEKVIDRAKEIISAQITQN